MNIGKKQLELINKSKEYIKKKESSDCDAVISSFCYFSCFGTTPGYAKLKLWSEGWMFFGKFFKIILKNFLLIMTLSNYVVLSSEKEKKKYSQIIVSWASKKDFDNNGSYNDKYFKTNSRTVKNSLWFLIYLDKSPPQQFDSNIRIFKKEDDAPKFSLIFLLKILISNFIQNKGSIKRTFHTTSILSVFAKLATEKIETEIKNGYFSSIVMPYEGQPFHQSFFFSAKKINKKIITIGYIHSAPTPLPTNLIYRRGSPDILFVSGNEQKKYFVNRLNWPEQKIKLIPSLRFRINDNTSMESSIFLPLTIFSKNKILKIFDEFLSNSKPESLFPLTVKNHPAMANSFYHLYLEKKLQQTIKKYQNRFSEKQINNKVSFFIGSSGAVIEALERKIDVIHICTDPILESYCEKLWPGLYVLQLNKYLYRYKLKKNNQFINFGKKEENMFEKYFDNTHHF